MLFIEGDISEAELEQIALELHNPLIQRASNKNKEQFKADNGMGIVIPRVQLDNTGIIVDDVDLNVSDDELIKIGKEGIANEDGTRRGPLGMQLAYMKAVQAYFRDVEKRNPTDVELETLAQTWSEHCKHTIFASPIDEFKNGIFKDFIKRATDEIRAERKRNASSRRRTGSGDSEKDSGLRQNDNIEVGDYPTNGDICVSVFSDDSGAIIFDENHLITDKVETHNSPSALDPFGGAITGIVGVNRDCIGFGKMAKPVLNRYGFCLADPRKTLESDVLVKEIRPLGLHSAVTDNGAGGLASSVGEMGEASGGFHLELDKVPLKYPGMQPWEIWISESQERMSLAVPPENVETIMTMLNKRGVEAWDIGEFTDTGRAHLSYDGDTVMDISMDFLHDGLPETPLKTTFTRGGEAEPDLPEPSDYTQTLIDMMGRLNICSKEFVSAQYDHNVQGSAVLGPVQGSGRVCAEATVSRPVLKSKRAAVLSQGLAPRYSDIDTHHMARAALDSAVRHAIATGGDIDHLAILDNVCWCSSDEPERLGQLKRGMEAIYHLSKTYRTLVRLNIMICMSIWGIMFLKCMMRQIMHFTAP